MGNQKLVAFVALPYRYPFTAHYREIFAPALRSAGYEPEIANDIYGSGRVIDDIQSCILRAELMVCELTGRNPNVLYELGLAHALGKRTILVSEYEEDIPFDLQHLRYIPYNPEETDWQDKLRNKITAAAASIATPGRGDVPPLYAQLLPAEVIHAATGTHSRQMYAIIGLRNLEPDEGRAFQRFRLDAKKNPNPVANLWADPQPGNRVEANIVEEEVGPALSIRFVSTAGSFSPAVGVHPDGLLAKKVPHDCTYLTFSARAVPATGDQIGLTPAVAVRVVNGHAEHWRYLKPTGETDTFALQPKTGTFAVDLSDVCRWQLFRGAGNHAPSPRVASFEVLTSVVFELGYETRAGALLHGQGEVQIFEIRFATTEEVVQLLERPAAQA